MSDTTNRDRGRKESYKKHKLPCDCWHCISGKEKKRILKDKELKKKNG